MQTCDLKLVYRCVSLWRIRTHSTYGFAEREVTESSLLALSQACMVVRSARELWTELNAAESPEWQLDSVRVLIYAIGRWCCR